MKQGNNPYKNTPMLFAEEEKERSNTSTSQRLRRNDVSMESRDKKKKCC